MRFSPSLLLYVPPLLGCFWVLVTGWPGGFSVDMRVVVDEGRRFHFDGHQEPMFGLVWAGIQALLPTVPALAMSFAAQVIVFFLAFAWMARDAAREGSVAAAVVASLSSFLPPLTCFVVMVESNIITGIAWIAAMAMSPAAGTRWRAALVGLLLWYGFAIRSGMILAVVPMTFACLRLARPEQKVSRSVLLAIAFGLGSQGLSYGISQVFLGAPTRDRVLAVSQLFDMGGVYERTGVHHVPEFVVTPGHRPEEVLALYEPVLCSSMFWRGDDKPVFRLPLTREEGQAIREAWLRTIREHPWAWLEVKARYAGLFLMIGVEWAFDYWPSYAANRELGLSQPEDVSTTPIGLYANHTATWLVWKGWFWLVLVGGAVLMAAVLRTARALPGAAAFVAGLCTMVPHFAFGQGALARYYFLPYTLFVGSLLLVLPGLLARMRGGKGGVVRADPAAD